MSEFLESLCRTDWSIPSICTGLRFFLVVILKLSKFIHFSDFFKGPKEDIIEKCAIIFGFYFIKTGISLCTSDVN